VRGFVFLSTQTNNFKGKDLKLNIIHNIIRYFSLPLMVFFLNACATTTNIIPPYEKLGNVSFVINGKIDYIGNQEYIPRTIHNDSSNETSLIIKYQYHVNYGKENIPQGLHVANLFNPLVIIGFPIGQDTLVVIGKIDIMKQGDVIKTYSAACSFEKTRSLFYQGPTFSELRKTGLLEVRDNIEAQMYRDREFLQKLNGTEFPEIKQ
jgi:hypothetical protein